MIADVARSEWVKLRTVRSTFDPPHRRRAIAAVVGVVLVVPVFIQGLPSASQDAITKYLPSVAGQAIIGRTKFSPSGHLLSPWAGFAVFCGYAAAALAACAIMLNRRDA